MPRNHDLNHERNENVCAKIWIIQLCRRETAGERAAQTQQRGIEDVMTLALITISGEKAQQGLIPKEVGQERSDGSGEALCVPGEVPIAFQIARCLIKGTPEKFGEDCKLFGEVREHRTLCHARFYGNLGDTDRIEAAGFPKRLDCGDNGGPGLTGSRLNVFDALDHDAFITKLTKVKKWARAR